MYKIACVSPSNKLPQLDDPLNISTVFLENINDVENIEEYDGIVIKEPNADYIFPICEMVINLRKQKIFLSGSSQLGKVIQSV